MSARWNRRALRQRLSSLGGLALVACGGAAPAGPGAEPPAVVPEGGHGGPLGVALPGQRPRYDLAGQRLVFMAGADGARDLRVLSLATGELRELNGPGDDIDPVWTPDGRIVFASNRGGDYDLWRIDPDSLALDELTHLEGDELEPTVAAIPFAYYAVRNGICGGGAEGRLLDAYQKVVFTRRGTQSSEIWFSSIEPRELPAQLSPRPGEAAPRLSPHGTHQGRLSRARARCSEPTFALDGLSLVWSCDGAIEDAPAEYAQSFDAALAAIQTPPPPGCEGEADLETCFRNLTHVYASYPGHAVSEPGAGLVRPALSTNQTLLLADTAGTPMQRPRFAQGSSWSRLPIEAARAEHLVWSPTGSELAFEAGGQVQRLATRFYLQGVQNLRLFPELFGAGESKLLRQNGFVVRPAQHEEFYVLHDQLRYAHKPQFISADVALQAFRDEFSRLLEQGERSAEKSLHALTGALSKHYLARAARPATAAGVASAQRDHYLAVLFATAWAPLEAAASMERLDDAERMEAQLSGADAALAARVAKLARPVAARLPEELPRVVARLPASIRAEVQQHLDAMLAHAGIAPLSVPGRKQPVKVDFSQFAIRGAYAENELGAYFLAMNWLGALPVPLDASLGELIDTLQRTQLGAQSAWAHWQRINALVGSFMGRPVDATLDDVRQELAATPRFEAADFEARLLQRRGPVPIRDADNEDRALLVTVFPKRVGLDVTFFRQLTWPALERPMPSSLDVFAVLGNARAREHALADVEQIAAQYRELLAALSAKTPAAGGQHGYASTDLYHGWLALLVALAAPLDLPESSALAFARSLAWKDRQLYSALAGYTELKHSAVLYAMQDIGAECDGETSYYVGVEEPAVPPARGFVEPNLAFYEGLAALARRSYEQLYGDALGPSASQWQAEGETRNNALSFALDLAELARAELAGVPLSAQQAAWIEFVAAKLEPLTLGLEAGSHMVSMGGAGRQERGVALVTDIHTNSSRGAALALGVGRIFDLWAVVPAPVGQTLTQGGALSFYEFIVPMAQRPTDADWGQQLETGEAAPAAHLDPQLHRGAVKRPTQLALALALLGAAPSRAPERELRLALGGDVMFGRGTEHGWRAHGGEQPFGAFGSTLRRADLAFVNLEMGVCSEARPPGPLPLLWAPPERLDALQVAGIDAVSVANNHALDCGPSGLDATLEALARRGIAAVGVAPSGTARFGRDVLLLGATLTPPPYRSHGAAPLVSRPPELAAGPYGSDLVTRVATLRRADPAALLLISLHWGRERAREPAAWQRQLAHRLVDAGANLIAGHGSHTRQLSEHYRDAVVAYGLGNLVFDDGTALGRAQPPLLVHFRRGPNGWRAQGETTP